MKLRLPDHLYVREGSVYSLTEEARFWCEQNMDGAWRVTHKNKTSDALGKTNEQLDAVGQQPNTSVVFAGSVTVKLRVETGENLLVKPFEIASYVESWVELDCEKERDAVLFKLHWF